MTLRYHPKTKPFKHQARAALRALRQGNMAFFMEPGTGKTKAAIDAACMQHLRGLVNRVVVICPISAMQVWKDELALHKGPMPGMKWRVINYDKLSRREREYPHRKNQGRWVYPHIGRIHRFNPDLIICDESHRLKRASANRAQSTWKLVETLRKGRNDGLPFVYLLSGTPNPKGWIDLFSQYRVMDPSIFGTSVTEFKDLYCEYGQGKRRFTIIRYKNKEWIKEKVRASAFVISKDKCLDLPAQLWQNVRVRLDSEIRGLYDTMVDEMLVEIQGEELTASNAGVLRTRLLQITGGFLTDGQVVHQKKLKALEDIAVDLLDAGEPLIVYHRFLAEGRSIGGMLADLGYGTYMIDGSTPRKAREIMTKNFQAGGNTALVMQADTGSEAITLTRGREMVFYSLPDSWSTYRQCCDRVHRIGQTRKVRYRHLVVPGTVDMSVLRTLRRKADMHQELMGNVEGFLRGTQD